MYKFIKKLLYWFLLLVIYVFYVTDVHATDIINSSFELQDNSWTKTTSTVQFSITGQEYYEATNSAEISYTPTSSQGIKQNILIEPDQTYKLSGFIKATTAKKAFIRSAWYQAGSTSQLKTDDSPVMSTSTDWNLVEFIVTSPVNAASAEIRLLVSEGTAYFDQITVQKYIAPAPTTAVTSPPSTQPVTIVPTGAATPTISPAYNNIYISEALVYPDAGIPEWVELYNGNSFSVNLTNWYIDDIPDGGSLPKMISLTIPAFGYGVIEMSSALFNNGGDSIRLLDPDKQLKDSIEYTNAKKNTTIGRISFNDNNICMLLPTKGAANGNCIDMENIPEQEEEEFQEGSNILSSKTNQSATASKKNPTTTLIKNKGQNIPTDISKTPQTTKDSSKKNTNQPSENAKQTAPFLATTYSLLSFISVGAKMIFTRE